MSWPAALKLILIWYEICSKAEMWYALLIQLLKSQFQFVPFILVIAIISVWFWFIDLVVLELPRPVVSLPWLCLEAATFGLNSHLLVSHSILAFTLTISFQIFMCSYSCISILHLPEIMLVFIEILLCFVGLKQWIWFTFCIAIFTWFEFEFLMLIFAS